MFNKKGITIPVLGTVFIVIAIIGLASLNLFILPLEAGNIQKGGVSISLSNNVEFWKKSFDESLQIISKKSAYDLGKIVGVEGI